MAMPRLLQRFIGFAWLAFLCVAIAVVVLHPDMWWLTVVSLVLLWMWGFTLSHAYIMTHDGIGPRRE